MHDKDFDEIDDNRSAVIVAYLVIFILGLLAGLFSGIFIL